MQHKNYRQFSIILTITLLIVSLLCLFLFIPVNAQEVSEPKQIRNITVDARLCNNSDCSSFVQLADDFVMIISEDTGEVQALNGSNTSNGWYNFILKEDHSILEFFKIRVLYGCGRLFEIRIRLIPVVADRAVLEIPLKEPCLERLTYIPVILH